MYFHYSYNLIHERTRRTVEKTFGIWKRRFFCLSKELSTVKLLTFTTIIVACAVLHNLSLILNDILEEEEEQEQDENANDEIPIEPYW